MALEEPLGGSSDSNVLRAIHVERNMTMAVKLLPRELISGPMGVHTFPEDVKKLQALVHPHIVRYLGGAMENGLPYLALELIDGESLGDRIARLGRLPWETAVELADQVCSALDFAHRKNCVHQRLTPRRVLLSKDDQVKLVGFETAWTDYDEVLGLRCPMHEAHYLAPEQFRGKASAKLPPADLFSLGVILYQCLTGELPWTASTPAELIRARRAAPAPRVSTKVLDCPVWLDALVSRLLQRKRHDRLPSAEATHRAIVDAKQKVAEGVGAAKHAVAGKRGVLALGADRNELRRLRKRPESSPDADAPFYERAWFLAACLGLLIAIGVWVMWPASEEQLFAKAQPLMNSDDPTEWRRAEDQYLAELLRRFPNTQYADEIDQFQHRLAVHRARERVKNIDRFGREPRTEAERRYAEARRDERDGDRVSAWQQYDAIVELLKGSSDADDQAFATLAREGSQRIRQLADDPNEQLELVRSQLAQAEEKIESGRLLEARKTLRAVIGLYDGNREMRPLVREARSLLDQVDAGGDPPMKNQP